MRIQALLIASNPFTNTYEKHTRREAEEKEYMYVKVYK
jgi:hypothetical protein